MLAHRAMWAQREILAQTVLFLAHKEYKAKKEIKAFPAQLARRQKMRLLAQSLRL